MTSEKSITYGTYSPNSLQYSLKKMCRYYCVLPGEQCLTSEEMKGKTVIIDVTESPIQRPKKEQKDY
jgi:hypothetical protein